MSSVNSVILDPARIAAVRGLGVLNSRLRDPLEQFTGQAAKAVGAPVASISLLDGERQYFVTIHGIPSTDAPMRHCPVQQSICQYTVASNAPQAIHDLRDDPRIGRALPLAGLEVLAYLGVPLRAPDGAVVGSLCVVDGRPRAWSSADITVLTELSGAIVQFLSLRAQVLDRVLLDSVTGLPGETLFLARCQTTRENHGQGRSAMYRIEIPELQPSVRRLGSPARDDAALRRAAERLAEAVGTLDVVGHLQTGVFGVFAHELADERDALQFAARLRGALRTDAGSGGVDAVRIGIALCAEPSESISELVRRAEHVIRGAAGEGSVTEIARRAA